MNEIHGENTLYQRKLDFDDFLDIDNIFALYHSLDEIMVELDDLIVNNQITLTLDEEDPKKLYFQFDIEVNNTDRQITITLYKKFNEHIKYIEHIRQSEIVSLAKQYKRALYQNEKEKDFHYKNCVFPLYIIERIIKIK